MAPARGGSSWNRRVLVGVLCLAAVGLGSAALAWACTPQASISASTTTVTPGQRVALSGSGFVDGGAVAITWNGGQQLATATGPSFSTAVTIPQAPAKAHFITATGYDNDGKVAGTTQFAVEVVAPAGSQGSSGDGAPSGAGQPAAGDQAQSGASEPSRSDERGSSRDRSRGERSSQVGGAPGGQTGGAARPRGDSSQPTAFPSTESSRSGSGGDRSALAGRPSVRSAGSDLWSGFGPGRAPLAVADSTTDSGPSSSALILGVLGLGLLSLLAGIGTVGARRARARAQRH